LDQSEDRSELPQAYADALELRDAGMSEQQIAERLRVPTVAIASMLSVAEAKLASLRAARVDGEQQ
jgi:DNA-directed RNA polymerase specialized sigma24 family protein